MNRRERGGEIENGGAREGGKGRGREVVNRRARNVRWREGKGDRGRGGEIVNGGS